MNRPTILDRLRISTEPVVWKEAVGAILGALVLLNVIDLTPEQISGILVAVSAVGAVFVRKAVTPNPHVDAIVVDARETEHREVATYLAAVERQRRAPKGPRPFSERRSGG